MVLHGVVAVALAALAARTGGASYVECALMSGDGRVLQLAEKMQFEDPAQLAPLATSDGDDSTPFYVRQDGTPAVDLFVAPPGAVPSSTMAMVQAVASNLGGTDGDGTTVEVLGVDSVTLHAPSCRVNPSPVARFAPPSIDANLARSRTVVARTVLLTVYARVLTTTPAGARAVATRSLSASAYLYYQAPGPMLEWDGAVHLGLDTGDAVPKLFGPQYNPEDMDDYIVVPHNMTWLLPLAADPAAACAPVPGGCRTLEVAGGTVVYCPPALPAAHAAPLPPCPEISHWKQLPDDHHNLPEPGTAFNAAVLTPDAIVAAVEALVHDETLHVVHLAVTGVDTTNDTTTVDLLVSEHATNAHAAVITYLCQFAHNATGWYWHHRAAVSASRVAVGAPDVDGVMTGFAVNWDCAPTDVDLDERRRHCGVPLYPPLARVGLNNGSVCRPLAAIPCHLPAAEKLHTAVMYWGLGEGLAMALCLGAFVAMWAVLRRRARRRAPASPAKK